MDNLVDPGRNLVRLDRILGDIVIALDLVIFIDKTPGVIAQAYARSRMPGSGAW